MKGNISEYNIHLADQIKPILSSTLAKTTNEEAEGQAGISRYIDLCLIIRLVALPSSQILSL